MVTTTRVAAGGVCTAIGARGPSKRRAPHGLQAGDSARTCDAQLPPLPHCGNAISRTDRRADAHRLQLVDGDRAGLRGAGTGEGRTSVGCGTREWLVPRQATHLLCLHRVRVNSSILCSLHGVGGEYGARRVQRCGYVERPPPPPHEGSRTQPRLGARRSCSVRAGCSVRRVITIHLMPPPARARAQ